MRLLELATALSSDKGDQALIGLIAREPSHYDHIDAQVTAEAVEAHLGGMAGGPVEKYRLPNLNAFNFVVHEALGGGGQRSLRVDNLGKTYGTALLRMEVEEPG